MFALSLRPVFPQHAPNWTALLLSLMLFLTPALGVPSEELLQDSWKSLLVSQFAICTAIVFLIYRWFDQEPLRFHPLAFLPLLLCAYALGSMAWAHAYLAGAEAIRWFIFSLLFVVGLNSLTIDRVARVAWGIHLGALVASLWTALQFWFDFQLFPQGPNPASTFVNRNFLAEYVVCTVPISVYLITTIRQLPAALLLSASLGLNISALMMAGTRSALAGLLALAVLVPLALWRERRLYAINGWHLKNACVVALALLLSTVVLGSFKTANPQLVREFGAISALERAFTRGQSFAKTEEYSVGSFSVRMTMWKATLRMIADNPITGVGAGSWEVRAPLYQEAGSQLETDFYAHNEFLQLIGEYGVVGWLFLIGLLAYLLRATAVTWRVQSIAASEESALRSFTLLGLGVLMLVSNAGFPWRLAATGALFAVFLAILVASDLRRVRVNGAVNRGLMPGTATISSGIGLLFCSWLLATYISWQAIECERKLVRGVKAALTISLSGDPTNPVWTTDKKTIAKLMEEGIAINAHYRKLSATAADAMARWGDWPGAIRIWESVLASRPYVVIVMTNIARGYLQTGDYAKAQNYVDRASAQQPSAQSLVPLQVLIWSRTGKEKMAMEQTRLLLDSGVVNFELAQVAYRLGTRLDDPALAIRALQLQATHWPRLAVGAWLHAARLYEESRIKDDNKALAAYQAALDAATIREKVDVLEQIPASFRSRMRAKL